MTSRLASPCWETHSREQLFFLLRHQQRETAAKIVCLLLTSLACASGGRIALRPCMAATGTLARKQIQMTTSSCPDSLERHLAGALEPTGYFTSLESRVSDL
mmetsp:Transcript_16453/g.51055  ORF Transcript_16453/g.51055 Transcript_16453/m.51055 type:complete len:102 (+) Transcript_16453:1932-2237(+)